MEILNKIWSYITFKKQTTKEGDSFLKAMHLSNKISILMFLVAVVVIISRYFI